MKPSTPKSIVVSDFAHIGSILLGTWYHFRPFGRPFQGHPLQTLSSCGDMLSSKFHQTQHHWWFVCWGCKSIVKKSAAQAANIFSHKQTGALSVNTRMLACHGWLFFGHTSCSIPCDPPSQSHNAALPIKKNRSPVPAIPAPVQQKQRLLSWGLQEKCPFGKRNPPKKSRLAYAVRSYYIYKM